MRPEGNGMVSGSAKVPKNKSRLFVAGVVLLSLCVIGILVNVLAVRTMNSREWESMSNDVYLRLILDAILGLAGILLVLYDRFTKNSTGKSE